MEKEILEIVTNISTPLAFAGIIAAILFFTLKQIILQKIFPQLTKQLSSEIIKLIVDRLFVLSLVSMTLGSTGYIVGVIFEAKVRPQSENIYTVPVHVKEFQVWKGYYICPQGKTIAHLEIKSVFDEKDEKGLTVLSIFNAYPNRNDKVETIQFRLKGYYNTLTRKLELQPIPDSWGETNKDRYYQALGLIGRVSEDGRVYSGGMSDNGHLTSHCPEFYFSLN